MLVTRWWILWLFMQTVLAGAQTGQKDEASLWQATVQLSGPGCEETKPLPVFWLDMPAGTGTRGWLRIGDVRLYRVTGDDWGALTLYRCPAWNAAGAEDFNDALSWPAAGRLTLRAQERALLGQVRETAPGSEPCDWREAEFRLERVWEKFPWPSPPLWQAEWAALAQKARADAAEKAQQLHRAMDYWLAAIRLAPHRSDLQVDMAVWALTSGIYKQVEDQLIQALAKAEAASCTVPRRPIMRVSATPISI